MNIYVGNLNFQTPEEKLEQLFAAYGSIESVQIITDKYSGRSKGFAFVEMTDQESAQNAIEELNSHNLDGRNLVVNEAKPRERSQSFNRNRY